MKKLLATILAVVYLATSSGAVINAHYCMGKMYSVDFSTNNKCSKCGMKHEKGCCESKAKILQAQDVHQLAGTAISFQPYYAVITPAYNIYSATFPLLAPAFTAHNNSPPGALSKSLYILYCVFRL